MFASTLPLYFFLGALLYLFPKAGALVVLGLLGLKALCRR
jgi:hypothetical protein